MTPKNTQLSVDGIISLLVGRVKNPDYTTSVAADKASAELITLINEALVGLPDRIKGVRVSGVPTLHHETDKVSVQDLRLIIAQLATPTKGAKDEE